VTVPRNRERPGEGSPDEEGSTPMENPASVARRMARSWDPAQGDMTDLVDRVASRLADDANHELRQALSALTTELELADHRTDGEGVHLQRETVDKLLDQIDRSIRIVATHLDRSQVAQLLIKVQARPVDLADLTGEAVTRRDLDPQRGSIEADVEPVQVQADPEKLRTALGFLCSRFHAAGSTGTLHLEVEALEGGAAGFVGYDPPPLSRWALVEELEDPLEIGRMEVDVPYVRAVLERHGGSLFVDSRGDAVGYGFELPDEPPEHGVGGGTTPRTVG